MVNGLENIQSESTLSNSAWSEMSDFRARWFATRVKRYFSAKNIDTSKFIYRESFDSRHFLNRDGLAGYVFCEQDIMPGDHEIIMKNNIRSYESLGVTLLRSFNDYREGISGFSWRRS